MIDVPRFVRALGAWSVCLFVLLPAVPASAQTLGTIRGRVIDESGGAMPGASVEVSSPALVSGSQSGTTDGDGIYNISNLPIGEYRVAFELSGFQQVIQTGIVITAGFTAAINVTMKVGSLQETLTVTGASPVVDTTRTTPTVNLTNKFVTDVLPATKNLQELLGTTPGIIPTGKADLGGGQNAGGNYNVYGLSGQANYLLDGINTRQGNGGGASQGTGPDLASMEEVQVSAIAGGAEQALPGIFVNMIVKSGGNAFHSRVEVTGQDDRFQSNNLTDALRAQGVTVGDAYKSSRELTGDLGGPLLRDRLWFYVAGRQQDATRTALGFVRDPGSDGNWLTADDTPADRVSTLSNQTYKVTYQPAQKYKVIGLFTKNIEEFAAGITYSPLTPFPASRAFTYDPEEAKIELQSVQSNRFIFNVYFGRHHYDAIYDAQPESANQPSTFDNTTQLNLGPNISQDRRPRNSLQTGGSLSLFPSGDFLGRHELKAGFTVAELYQGSGIIDGLHGNYVLIYDTIGGVPHQPFQIRTYNYPLEPRNYLRESGIFLQDTWRVGSRLTMNLGLRWDDFSTWIPEQVGTPSQFGAVIRQPFVDTGAWRALAPRVGATYDVAGDGKTVLKASWGHYNHTPTDAYPDAYNKNGITNITYRWRDLNGNGDYNPGEVNLDTNGPDFVSISGPAANFLSSGLRNPYSRQFTATLERELMGNVGARANYVFMRRYDEYGFFNVLRPSSAFTDQYSRQDPGPDGVTGNADDGSFVTIYDYPASLRGTNFIRNEQRNFEPGSEPTRHVFEAVVTRRQTGRMGMLGSLTWIRNDDVRTQNINSPNDEYFNQDKTWSWQAKLTGNYNMPYGILFSGTYQVYSGIVLQRTYQFRNIPSASTVTLRVEPYGDRQFPARHLMSLRAARELPVKKGRVKLTLDVLNALNNASVWSANAASGATFGLVTQIDAPRILRFGASYSF